MSWTVSDNALTSHVNSGGTSGAMPMGRFGRPVLYSRAGALVLGIERGER
jgi:hypothetical protein